MARLWRALLAAAAAPCGNTASGRCDTDAAKTAIHDALLKVGASAGPDEVALLDHTVELVLPFTVCPTSIVECPECAVRDCATLDEAERQHLQARALRSLSAAFGGARCG